MGPRSQQEEVSAHAQGKERHRKEQPDQEETLLPSKFLLPGCLLRILFFYLSGGQNQLIAGLFHGVGHGLEIREGGIELHGSGFCAKVHAG